MSHSWVHPREDVLTGPSVLSRRPQHLARSPSSAPRSSLPHLRFSATCPLAVQDPLATRLPRFSPAPLPPYACSSHCPHSPSQSQFRTRSFPRAARVGSWTLVGRPELSSCRSPFQRQRFPAGAPARRCPLCACVQREARSAAVAPEHEEARAVRERRGLPLPQRCTISVRGLRGSARRSAPGGPAGPPGRPGR